MPIISMKEPNTKIIDPIRTPFFSITAHAPLLTLMSFGWSARREDFLAARISNSIEICTPKNPPIAAPAPAPTDMRSKPATSHASAPPNTAPTKILMRNRRPPRDPTTAPRIDPRPTATGVIPPPMINPMSVPTVPITAMPNRMSNTFHPVRELASASLIPNDPISSSSRACHHPSKVNFNPWACDDRNTPGFRRWLMLMDTHEIFVHVDPLFDPLPKVFGAALHHNFRPAEHPPFSQRALRLCCAPDVLRKNRNEHEIRI